MPLPDAETNSIPLPSMIELPSTDRLALRLITRRDGKLLEYL